MQLHFQKTVEYMYGVQYLIRLVRTDQDRIIMQNHWELLMYKLSQLVKIIQ